MKEPDKVSDSLLRLITGTLIAAIRDRRGLSQVTVAKTLGISQSTFSRIESGDLWDGERRTRIVSALGIDEIGFLTLRMSVIREMNRITGVTYGTERLWADWEFTVSSKTRLGLVMFAANLVTDTEFGTGESL